MLYVQNNMSNMHHGLLSNRKLGHVILINIVRHLDRQTKYS